MPAPAPADTLPGDNQSGTLADQGITHIVRTAQTLPVAGAAQLRNDTAVSVMESGNMQSTSRDRQLSGLKPIRDPVRAAEVARMRWDKAENVARRKLGEMAGGTWQAAVATSVEHVWDQFIASGDHRAASWLFKTAGLTRPQNDHANQAGTVADGGAQLNLSAGAVRELLAALRDRRNSGAPGGSGDTAE